jgi:WD40 repeat protein/serine/threonine protein kinase
MGLRYPCHSQLQSKRMTLGDPPVSGTSIKELTASQYQRLSQLLDESLDLSLEARAEWLAALDGSEPGWAAFLRDMFSSQGQDKQRLLRTRGYLAGQAGALAGDESVLLGKLFGPYRVLSLLGHGGMGSVWLAERADGLFARQVALKLVHPALVSRVLMERSAREREILASLSHPNIARLIDAGFADDGQPYLALEYVAGVPITLYCDERRLPLRARLEIFRQVLSAVQYAHAHLVIHRDLKPSNIMVTSEGQVYLLDFGIAKLLTEGEAKETELTRIGGRALTPDYAAPEQIAGAPITTAADVYALGVMLYELLVGERPYRLKRDTRGALEEAILQADPLPPSRAVPTEIAARARGTSGKPRSSLVDSDLDTIVIKALKKLPAERYATANAFDEDIARYLRGDAVLAQRDSLAYRVRKFARRNRFAIGAAGFVMLILATGLAATSYEATVAAQQRDAALAARTRALTQTANARLKESDAAGAMAILLELSPNQATGSARDPEELNAFQQARAADAQRLVVTGHEDSVHTVAYSPDGRRVVTASADATARIWDSVTGRQLTVLTGHTKAVRSAFFSSDGEKVVTAGYDGTARIWNAATGQQLMLLTGHNGRIHFAVFSPDGHTIVAASGDGTAQVWDVDQGRQLLELKGHSELMTRAVFSPDGKHIATSSSDRTASIWDAATGREIVQMKGHANQVWSVAFSPDGRRAVTASFDDTARIWDAESGRQLQVLSGHKNVVTSAEFSADGGRVVTSSEDATARVWDATTGRELRLLNGHNDMLEMAAFSPDGRQIVTAGRDGTARIWDLESDSEMLILAQHSDLVASAEFSRNGNQILTSSWDGTLRIWDAITGAQIISLDPHNGHIEFAAFSADSRQIVAAGVDGKVRIWDSASGGAVATAIGHSERVETAQFSSDGTRIVSASWDKTARVWEAATGKQLLVLSGHTDKLDFAAFSPDGRYVVTASYDKTARLWNAVTGAQLAILAGHSDRVSSAMFSPDGRRIVTASNDRTARVWDAATAEPVFVLGGHEEGVEMADYSRDGKRIVTGSYDRTARIWDAQTGEQLKILSGHQDLVETAWFSRDGERVVTASDDKTARIWDARAAALGAQFTWAQAAQFDPLPSGERFRLGLPAPTDVHRWPTPRGKCDDSAAAPYDPDRLAPGVTQEKIVTDIAIAACADEAKGSAKAARAIYQHGRALAASRKFSAARRDFEQAASQGYRIARVDLGILESDPSAGMLDVHSAIMLYERAWQEGVSIAAFRLGSLYEQGVGGSEGGKTPLLPDPTQAWLWYAMGAAAGEPNALARLAERDEVTANARLQSFSNYAAAAERARREDWPDDAWRDWRYRRASLARLLAREGMMQEVAKEYAEVRARYAPRPTIWRRLLSAE